MNRVLVEPSVQAKLDNLESRLELCDQFGTTLGYFVPASDRERVLYAWARDQFSDEEIDRAKRESGGLTITEVLAGLNK